MTYECPWRNTLYKTGDKATGWEGGGRGAEVRGQAGMPAREMRSGEGGKKKVES